ncbi:hypothetical protein [Telluribacter humicola]|uniref:hypothetical protein n=1 Tax=Telluribacter humicola TaxID=1720261 RepID=UPI001A975C10|nr:hypothetical protein [Telluribacter humicola]
MDLEVKQVKVYKFKDGANLVNIYIEPLPEGKGRLIVSTQYKIFQRYFDGCNPDICSFILNRGLYGICYALDNGLVGSVEYLVTQLTPIWDEFEEELRKEVEQKDTLYLTIPFRKIWYKTEKGFKSNKIGLGLTQSRVDVSDETGSNCGYMIARLGGGFEVGLNKDKDSAYFAYPVDIWNSYSVATNRPFVAIEKKGGDAQ